MIKLSKLINYNIIIIYVNRFIKINYFILIINKIIIKGTINLFINNVYKLYEFSYSIVFNYNS